jgi:ABC-type uncharacterized transport system permease subunit
VEKLAIFQGTAQRNVKIGVVVIVTGIARMIVNATTVVDRDIYHAIVTDLVEEVVVAVAAAVDLLT